MVWYCNRFYSIPNNKRNLCVHFQFTRFTFNLVEPKHALTVTYSGWFQYNLSIIKFTKNLKMREENTKMDSFSNHMARTRHQPLFISQNLFLDVNNLFYSI